MKNLPTFIAKYLGVADSGTTVGNKGQCVGLVELWLAANGKPPVGGNAKDLLRYATPGVYKVTPNQPYNFPPVGAVLCWDATWGGGYGHTAVVVASNINKVATFEQNDPEGAAPSVATHDYTGIEGWVTW
jgi:hypothetical protein